MHKTLLLAIVALFVAACVPITPEPEPPALTPLPSPQPTSTPFLYSHEETGPIPKLAREKLSDCPNATSDDVAVKQDYNDFFEMKAGESADDPVAKNIPGYVDIVRVESVLDGETLTATFHLRDLPEQLEFGRKGVDSSSPEYMWMIHIDTDLVDKPEPERWEYMFGVFAMFHIGLTSGKPTLMPLEEGLQTILFKTIPPDRLDSVPIDSSVSVSNELNTISLNSEVPGISPDSSLRFIAVDMVLNAHDGVSCLPE